MHCFCPTLLEESLVLWVVPATYQVLMSLTPPVAVTHWVMVCLCSYSPVVLGEIQEKLYFALVIHFNFPGTWFCQWELAWVVSQELSKKWVGIFFRGGESCFCFFALFLNDQLTKGTHDWLFGRQVVQLEELLAVRHSVFVVGNAGTGKSKVRKIASSCSAIEGRNFGLACFQSYLKVPFVHVPHNFELEAEALILFFDQLTLFFFILVAGRA